MAIERNLNMAPGALLSGMGLVLEAPKGKSEGDAKKKSTRDEARGLFLDVGTDPIDLFDASTPSGVQYVGKEKHDDIVLIEVEGDQ